MWNTHAHATATGRPEPPPQKPQAEHRRERRGQEKRGSTRTARRQRARQQEKSGRRSPMGALIRACAEFGRLQCSLERLGGSKGKKGTGPLIRAAPHTLRSLQAVLLRLCKQGSDHSAGSMPAWPAAALGSSLPPRLSAGPAPAAAPPLPGSSLPPPPGCISSHSGSGGYPNRALSSQRRGAMSGSAASTRCSACVQRGAGWGAELPSTRLD